VHLVELAALATWVAQLDGTLIYLNDAAARLLGAPAESLLGSRSWQKLVNPADRHLVWPKLDASGQHVTHEYRLANPLRWIRDRRYRFHDPTDEIDYIGGTWEDITARRHAQQARAEQRCREQRAQQRQRLESLRRLSSGVAHNLSNTLTPIMSFSELALGSLPHGHPAADDMQQVISSSRQAVAILQQLQAFSRKQHLQKQPFDINDLIRAAAPALRSVLGANIRLQTELCFAPALVRADRTRIEHVLLGLVSNARDAMPQGGKLTLRTELVTLRDEEIQGLGAGEYVRLFVQDTGTGIDPRIIDYIFEPFFTTRRPEQAAGLGLATAYGIISQHKGALFVESTLGQGATFHILLRHHEEGLQEPSTSEISIASLSSTNPRPTKPVILVVEDDDVVRDLIARVLRRHGYESITADGPEQALQIVARSPKFDLLLTDLIMPEMNGVQLAAQILKQRPELRVLYASGHSTSDLVQDAGMDTPHFLTKPFTAQSLIAKIREVLG
jgi:two-component system cell cycle sensor histidine kinase/response regulator CckA